MVGHKVSKKRWISKSTFSDILVVCSARRIRTYAETLQLQTDEEQVVEEPSLVRSPRPNAFAFQSHSRKKFQIKLLLYTRQFALAASHDSVSRDPRDASNRGIPFQAALAGVQGRRELMRHNLEGYMLKT